MNLLFQDPDSHLRYEIEIQRGKMDECIAELRLREISIVFGDD